MKWRITDVLSIANHPVLTRAKTMNRYSTTDRAVRHWLSSSDVGDVTMGRLRVGHCK